MHETTGRHARYAPLSGVVAVALVGAAVALVETQSSSPGESATAAEALAYIESDGGTLLAGAWLAALGLLALLWFLGSLRATLLEAEGGAGRLANAAFGGGIVAVGALAAAVLPLASGGLSVRSPRPPP